MNNTSINFYELGRRTAEKMSHRITLKNTLLTERKNTDKILAVERKATFDKKGLVDRMRTTMFKIYEDMDEMRKSMYSQALDLNNDIVNQMLITNRMLSQDKIKMMFKQEDRLAQQNFETIKQMWIIQYKSQIQTIEIFGKTEDLKAKQDKTFQDAFKAVQLSFTTGLRDLGEKLDKRLVDIVRKILNINMMMESVVQQFTDLNARVIQIDSSIKVFAARYAIELDNQMKLNRAFARHGGQIKTLAAGMATLPYPGTFGPAVIVLTDVDELMETLGKVGKKALGYDISRPAPTNPEAVLGRLDPDLLRKHNEAVAEAAAAQKK